MSAQYPSGPPLPAQPLLDYLTACYGDDLCMDRSGERVVSQRRCAAVCGVHKDTWALALERGQFGVFTADAIANRLGLHPFDIWGDAYWDVPIMEHLLEPGDRHKERLRTAS